MNLKRRHFLKLCGTAGGGLMLSIMFPAVGTQAAEAEAFVPNLLVRIEADNTVIFTLTKQEMGQGVTTGLSMIFADELGADLEKMKVIDADFDARFDHTVMGITGGSSSIRTCWDPVRKAAAMAREMLIQAAADSWNVSAKECYAEGGHVWHKGTSQVKTFGELVAKASMVPPQEDVKLKDPAEFKYIGKRIKNIRTKKIVCGAHKYGIDVSIPGMLHASIERSPVHQGTIKSYDDSEARKLSGVVDVIKIERRTKPVSVGVPGWDLYYDYTVQEGLAVIATSTWAAMNARKKLRIVWDDGKNGLADSSTFKQQIEKSSGSPLVVNESKGNVDSVFERTLKLVEASYEIGYMAHCLMEPLNTVANVSGNHCEIWSGTQFAKRFVEEVAATLDIPFENVTCHVLPAGGGFGRRWEPDFAIEATLLSKAVQKPLKVTWTREDDIKHDFYHSVQQDSHRLALDETNSIVAWNVDQYSCSKFLKGAPWNPYSYSIPNYRARKLDLPSPLETGPWRSVDDHKDVFTVESFIDEVANSLKVDPLEFRLKLLQKPLLTHDEGLLKTMEEDRLLTRQVLELAAEKSGWGKKSNLGIAVGRFSSHCAQVAEVNIDHGKLIVERVTVAVHCGIAVNPSMVEAQLQGAVIYALQALKYGDIKIKNGRVQQSNFHDYKMIRMDEVPEINVHIVPSSDPPKGVGEPGVPPLAPAVLNAVYAARGKRIRKLPVTKDDLA
ncbi:MAG TPA: molybdopterin cofactor-binding domain-containing protein [Chryseolinea sp.]